MGKSQVLMKPRLPRQRAWRSGCWMLEVGSWKLEIRDWKLEVGDWRLEVGDWRLEVGSLILDFGFWILDFGTSCLSTFSARASASSTKGNARTWGCMSPSMKLKKGNSSMTSTVLPSRSLSWMTREARHHHHPPPRSNHLPVTCPLVTSSFMSSQFQNRAEPSPLAWSTSKTPSRLPRTATNRGPSRGTK